MTVQLEHAPAGTAAAPPAMAHICREHPYVDSGPCNAGCLAFCGHRWGRAPALAPGVDCVVCVSMAAGTASR